MSLTLKSYPVTENSGRINNIFPGFSDVSISFKREDTPIISAGSGANNKVLIDVLGDITGSLNIGDGVYLYAKANTFDYDITAPVLDITFNSPNTEVTIDFDFAEVAAVGYLNYKQNYFVEAFLVSPSNELVKKYPSPIEVDGSAAGDVDISVSMLVDKLKNEILNTSGEVSNGREICQVKYREVWRENQTNSYILIDNQPIIIIFAAEPAPIEQFINKFELPRMWDGYPACINLLHSLQNITQNRLSTDFDELDINKEDITLQNTLASFGASDYGILQSNFNDNQKAIEANTRYIRFNIRALEKADYKTGDYNDTDYKTINTP